MRFIGIFERKYDNHSTDKLQADLQYPFQVKAQLRRYKKYTPILPQNEPAKVLTYKKLVLNMQTYECELGERNQIDTPDSVQLTHSVGKPGHGCDFGRTVP